MKNLCIKLFFCLVVNIPSTIVCMGLKESRYCDLSTIFQSLTVSKSNSFLSETKEILAQMGNTYNPEPADRNASLDEAHVLNDFWKQVSLQNQEKKDATLQKIAALNFTDAGYSLERYHYAAGVLAGANPNIKDYSGCTLIYVCALKKDYELCKLLLEKGACPNRKSSLGYPIDEAETVPFAQLLLKHGANVKELDCVGDNLLGRVMRFDYEPELIPLYKSKGVSPLHTYDHYNVTALHALAFRSDEYKKDIPKLYAKVNTLLQGLNQAEIMRLIRAKHLVRGTVFDILKNEKNNAGSNALKSILQKYLHQGSPKSLSSQSATDQKSNDSEECCICSDQLNSE